MTSGLEKAVKLAGQLQDKQREQAVSGFNTMANSGGQAVGGLQAIEQQVTDFRANAATERQHSWQGRAPPRH